MALSRSPAGVGRRAVREAAFCGGAAARCAAAALGRGGSAASVPGAVAPRPCRQPPRPAGCGLSAPTWTGGRRTCATGSVECFTGTNPILDDNGRTVTIHRERFNELIESEVAYLASIPVRPVTMDEVLDCLDPRRAAKFIQADVPKRFALRIRLVDSLAEWRQVPELAEVRHRLCTWYQRLRLVERGPGVGLKPFTEVVREVKAEGKNTVALAAAGIHKLQAMTGGKYSSEFLDRWLDGFLLSRIGSNMLLDQYMACASKEDGGLAKATGIVNPKTDVLAICRQASVYASKVCLHYQGITPTCTVENYREGLRGPQPEQPCSFSYIPGFLRYIMIELLKNSFKATVKYAEGPDDLRHRPVQVLVSCDEAHVAIRVSDRAGGIPSHVGDRIWSYLYGAAANGQQGCEAATPLSGYGVGLPLSRLHAQYLGGSLDIKTYPGYGTDASLTLPKLQKHQVEAIPPEITDAEFLLRGLNRH